jgi:hypothetical protein
MYVGEDIDTNIGYKIHNYCLKKHIDLFDAARFTISVDDLGNQDLINKGMEWCIDILKQSKCTSAELRVILNNEYRDSQTFYDKVIKNKSDDELVFFFHAKGISNLTTDGISKESIFHWINFIYFICLNEISDVENELYHTSKNTYGALLLHSISRPEDFPFLYAGTGFWVNKKGLTMLMESGRIKDIPLYSKYFAENYFGNFLSFYNSYGMASVNKAWFDFEDFGPMFLYYGTEEEWMTMARMVGKEEGFREYINDVRKNTGFYV